MYDKKVLPNGVTIVSEHMPHVRSAAIGIWIGVGSRHEAAAENGAAHFIEHMLFKGTANYSAAQLAGIMDGIGGQINAFTTRERTCFYARVLDSHLSTAIDLLADMFFHSNFSEPDIQSERNVILEEIDMYDDTPEDFVTERLFSHAFPGPLGRPVLGTPDTLSHMTGLSLREFMHQNYTPEHLVISLCGSFTPQHIDEISAFFSRLPKGVQHDLPASQYTPTILSQEKAIEQNHLCIAFPSICARDPRRFTMQLMSSIFGGGMSSRLFQTMREDRGLCYSIYSFSALFHDNGLFCIATALGKTTEDEALSLIVQEIEKLLADGVTDEELYRAREQIKSNLVMTMESTSARMQKLGAGVLTFGHSLSPDEVIAHYDAVTKEDILTFSRDLFQSTQISFSALGTVKSVESYRDFFGSVAF